MRRPWFTGDGNRVRRGRGIAIGIESYRGWVLRGAAILALAGALSSCSAGAPETRAPLQLSRSASADPGAVLDREWLVPLAADNWTVDVGDVVGDAAAEIILAGRSEIRILDGAGRVLETIDMPPPAASYGFVADVNGDGKGEIVLGGADDSTARLRVIDGKGRIVAAGTGGSLVSGVTTPHFALDGYVYFTAGSALGSTPRVTGRFNIREESIEWLREDGVLPLGLVYSPTTDLIGVHNRGTGRDLPRAGGADNAGQVAPAGRAGSEDRGFASTSTPPGRSAALVVGRDGSTVTYAPFGAPVMEGRRIDGAVSSVKAHPVATPDGDSTLTLAVVNRASMLYGGPSRIHLLDESGTAQATYEGPEAAEASVAVLPKRPRPGDGGPDTAAAGSPATGGAAGGARYEPFVTAVWSTTGTVELLDENLELLHSRDLPGHHHKARLQYRGDLTADGVAEIIVSTLNRLYLMSPDLEVMVEAHFRTEVQRVWPFTAGGETGLLVQAGDLHYLTPAPNPFGVGNEAADALDSRRPPQLEVTGDGNLADAAGVSPVAELSHRGGLAVLGVRDVAGDATPEVVLLDRAAGTVTVTTPELGIVSVFGVPEDLAKFELVDDLDGDGKDDLVFVSADSLSAVLAMNGEGRVLFRTPLFHSTDTTLVPQTCTGSRLFLTVVTGHMLRPRGVYALSSSTGTFDYFYPTAGFPNSVDRFGNTILIGTYTPGNGHTMVRPDGFTDRDDHMFLHAIRPDGTVHPMAGPVDFGEPGGRLTFFAMDRNGDGAEETYVTPRRDPTYNPGTTGVYRIRPNGETVPVLDGPPDTRTDPHVASLRGEDWLILNYPKLSRLEVVSPELEIVDQMQTGGSAYIAALELRYPEDKREEADGREGSRAGANSPQDPSALPGLAVATLADETLQIQEIGGSAQVVIGWRDAPISSLNAGPGKKSPAAYLILTGPDRLAVLRAQPGAGER